MVEFTHTNLGKIFNIPGRDATLAILHCSWSQDEPNNIAITKAQKRMMASGSKVNIEPRPAENGTQNEAG